MAPLDSFQSSQQLPSMLLDMQKSEKVLCHLQEQMSQWKRLLETSIAAPWW